MCEMGWETLDNGFTLLIEKEEMWAKMLADVLKDNGIPYVARPTYGAGFVIKTGKQDIIKIYVPTEYFKQASEFTEILFSENEDVPKNH